MQQPSTSPVFEFDAIGTRWWCEALDTSTISDELQRKTLQLCDEFNRAYSRFRDDSLIGQLNTNKVLPHPPQELCDIFALCHELYIASDGAFNISIGGVLHAQGYGSRKFSAATQPDFWQHTALSTAEIRIPQNATVDIDGIGKGWLIDKIVALFHTHGLHEFIVNGGGDMFIAAKNPVEIALENPSEPTKILRSIKITGGFAASSQHKRTWQDNGHERAHIIDPRINNTAKSGAHGVFVNAATATIADALATILLIRPKLHEQLAQRYNVQILIV